MTDNSTDATSSSQLCSNLFISMFSIRAMLLFPVSIFVLFLGLQKGCKRHSTKTVDNFEAFTCHLAAMELIWVLGGLFYTVALCYNQPGMITATLSFILIGFYGEILFHTLTCTERYVAVVYPITYLRMKTTQGERIRNLSIACVWLQCSFLISLNFVIPRGYSEVPLYCLLVFSIIVTTFCTISVLRILTRPDHREGCGKTKQVDQSKQRAFRIITTISSVQWLWFVGLLVSKLLIHFHFSTSGVVCVLGQAVLLLNLPSCLMMPLLYLHRAEKLPCRFHSK